MRSAAVALLGLGIGGGAALATAAAASVPPPVYGKAVDVVPVKGQVFVTPPGQRRMRLLAAKQIPVDSVVDTQRGTVRLISAVDRKGANQSGEFSGGSFRVLQPVSGQGLTELVLTGGNFGKCRKATAARHNRPPTLIRLLHARDRGKFRTRGRYSAATARGTVWETEDLCDGTLHEVSRDTVTVSFKGETVTLHRNGSLLNYCSPSGDTCTSVEKRGNDYTLGIGTVGPISRYRLCVTSPGGTTDCRTFRLKPGAINLSRVSWRHNFPAHGPGLYTVRWIDLTPKFGGPLGPDLFFVVP